MKTVTMPHPPKVQRFACGAIFFLIGLLLFSCSGVALKGSPAQTSGQASEPQNSESLHDGLSRDGASPSSLPLAGADGEWTDLSWGEGDGSSYTQMVGTNEDESDLSGVSQDDSMAGVGEVEKTAERSAQEALKVEEKNGQPPEGVKEEETADQARLYDAIDFCQKSQELWKEGKLEEAKRSLDQAYQSILDIKSNSDPQILQQIDDLRFLISKRILEIYASRFNGVQGNHNEIPLIMNNYVQAEIKRFQNAERDFFLESYARSGSYRPHILGKLEEAGLPLDLSWLPLIESGFKVRAFSRSRALGLWQFIPSTGYKFGLKRDLWIDERMDVEKSTDAAIEYLKELHEIFGDWTTVLAAYNCGEGTVLRRIRHQRINYLDDFWDLYGRLPRETARYVPRYLAVLHIMRDPDRYGFELNDPDPPLVYEEVQIAKRVRLKDVARRIGVSYNILVGLNPELRHKVTPEGYSLKVPPGKTQVLLANLERIPRYVPPKKQYVYHRVRRGETLSHIARKYRTSIRSIARANGIVQKNYIRVGQKLKIPVR